MCPGILSVLCILSLMCVCACVCVFLVCHTLCVWLLKVIKCVGSLAFDLRVLFCVKCFTTCVDVSTYE